MAPTTGGAPRQRGPGDRDDRSHAAGAATAPSGHPGLPARIAAAIRGWWATSSYSPDWMPQGLRHSLVGYLAALVLQVLAAIADAALVRDFPSFGMAGLLSILVVALVAISWGTRASLVATVAGVLLLNVVVFMPVSDWLYHPGRTAAEDGIFVAVGVIITFGATQLERARRAAERLAASLAVERARTRNALNALLQMAEAMMLDTDAGDPAEISSPGGAQILMERLAVLTRSVVGCQRVTMVAVAADGDRCSPIATVGIDANREAEWWLSWQRGEGDAGGERRLSDQLTEADVGVLRRGEEVTIAPAQPPATDQPGQPDALAQPGLPNLFGAHYLRLAPLMLRGQLVGVLALDFDIVARAEQAATAEERALLSATARLATLVIERDRLESDRAEAEANALALHKANRIMDEFVSTAIHELRNPLHVVGLTVDRLANRLTTARPTDEQMARLIGFALPVLEQMKVQTRRLKRLVDDMVEMTRIRSNQLELHLGEADLTAIVRDASDDQRLVWPKRTIEVELPASPTPISADADRIFQVVTNYLTNALKYSPADQPVVVALRIEGDQARVEVRDAGPGLAPDQQKLVWERFHRVPGVQEATGSGKGLGLGLFISRTSIERHGGEVGVDSQPGEGCTFWFTLPLSRPAGA